MARISEGGRDLKTRIVSVYRSTSCPRSQMPAGVQKCHSYLLTPPGSQGRGIPGRGNARNIEFWGNFLAHAHIFDICNTLFWRHIRIELDFFFLKHTLKIALNNLDPIKIELPAWKFQSTFLFRNIKCTLLVMHRDYPRKIFMEIKFAQTLDIFWY